jgi:hypothetical protein
MIQLYKSDPLISCVVLLSDTVSNTQVTNVYTYTMRGLISISFIKKTTSYGTEKIYLLYIFPLELHTIMTLLF